MRTRKLDYDLDSLQNVEASQGPRLRVVSETGSSVHELPSSGVVIIGRDSESGVCIESPEISREHARLHFGSVVELEDLGSSNGTIVRGEKLSPNSRVSLAVGDLIEIGQFTLFIQNSARQNSNSHTRRLLPHGYFEARVETECARAERMGSMFAIGRLHVSRELSSEQILALFAGILRADDELASYGPGEFEYLLSDASMQRIHKVSARLRKGLGNLDQADTYRLGVAVYPRDGRSSEYLMAVACDAVRGTDESVGPNQGFVVKDESMLKLHRLIERIAKGSISVLILGETGVGKEITASLVHEKSKRLGKPFVQLNCAALSESLIESELFGYEKGAFTGAMRSKPGLLETAQGGTIFLDEVGELPHSTQVKLLRVLEERKVMRVGGLEPKSIDVRIVSATNRDLAVEIEEGRFRQDLFFRLNGISVTVPPLRSRVAEISELARFFVNQICELDQRTDIPIISNEAMRWFENYSWPGNIRELRNVIERAVLLADDAQILPEHLPLEHMKAPVLQSSPMVSELAEELAASTPVNLGSPKKLLNEIQEFEKNRIIEALMACDGNQTKAAKVLGIARRTLIKRLDLYGIPRPRKKVPTSPNI